MDVYLMIQRQKKTILLDTKDTMTIYDLKDMISYIINVPAVDQELYFKDQLLDDELTLSDYGIIPNAAKAQNPANIGLAVRMPDGNFEELKIDEYSTTPDVPTFLKPQDSPDASDQASYSN
ncbi:elongin-B-like [Adelges cooleyi]|uniref:elongin-B-like n=1 Tax=Adelges cooleyi TaxID=133065 RepID=UPI00218042DA|nr:elongin-B-like [Adelges cooleyi]